MSIPSDNSVISKRISCSISGLSNQCNETQSKSSSVISGQWAPRTDHRCFTLFFLQILLTVAVYGVRLHLCNCLVHNGNLLYVNSVCWRGYRREILPVERVTALCNPSDYQDGRNTSSSLPN